MREEGKRREKERQRVRGRGKLIKMYRWRKEGA